MKISRLTDNSKIPKTPLTKKLRLSFTVDLLDKIETLFLSYLQKNLYKQIEKV